MTYKPCTVEFNAFPCVYEAGHPGAHYNRTMHMHWTDFHRKPTPEPRPAA